MSTRNLTTVMTALASLMVLLGIFMSIVAVMMLVR